MDREILFRMNKKELKPCPFCGGEAFYFDKAFSSREEAERALNGTEKSDS